MSIRYITAKLAQQIDEELMGTAGAFSIDQLMELAGLACAQTLATVYGKESHPRVLVCCGSGNQGGDGLVAARHLGMFGYKPTIWMPKPGSKDIYKRLHTQCTNMHIPTLPPAGGAGAAARRAPFDAALRLIARAGRPVVSVDIPSGWDVERGADSEGGAGGGASGAGQLGGAVLYPDVLLSLTAPKEGVRKFAGRHFLGGRFVPRTLEEKYELNLPPYPGFAQIVELPQRDHDGPLQVAAQGQ
ncbi:YjeF N-terminal domain-containing protein [Russula brevipes]|nr:YjeF N-terminal domain-containing protein [Russula brevipes]